ncbi:alkaline phosphatase-like protein [Piromyces finnis]|uniref:Alkaline phosphatase n=1 Tax=Piromyces finnis TaxID=1754191 RepID=A0A1Y1UTZ8_9FUNG|nr:alkaline phosphatase-like protein [Piromyces finnis]|eukprot:ORX41501.1 alkaline phosphatase-like protein [Piromyces finnis]
MKVSYLPVSNTDKPLLYSKNDLLKKNIIKNKIINYVFSICLIIFGGLFILFKNDINEKNDKNEPVNIIFMISDGFGPTSETFGRTYYQYINNYSYDTLTPLDEILVGQSRTRSYSSLITDSAAGGTAYSCGRKTYNYGVAVDPSGHPCATLLEGAHDKGMLTGIVVTSRVTHATPASFLGHARNRHEEDFIATWLAPNITNSNYDRQVDLLFGGGLCHFIPSYEHNSCRNDEKNLLEDTEFLFINDREKFDNLNDTNVLPVMGLFTPDHMSFEIDRDPKKEPALWEMTDKALRILSKAGNNKKGFFLLIEGSRIDMAAHGNDPAAHANDILAYYKTVDVVKKFVDKNPNTLVISVSDHETGGLALGYQPTKVYPKYIWHPEVITKVKKSTNKIALQIEALLKSADNIDNDEDDNSDTLYDQISDIIFETMGIDDTTENELKFIIESRIGRTPIELANYLAKMISHRSKIAWTTHGHSGADVNLYAYGKHSKLFQGSKENIEVGRLVERIMNINLDELTKRLFSNYELPKTNAAPNTMSRSNFDEIHYHH